MGKQVHSRGYKSGPGGWSSVGGWAADKSSKQLQHEVLKGSTDKPALCVNFRRPREPKTDLLISLLLYYILELCHPCHVTHYTLCRIMLPHYASFSRADTKSAIRKKFLFIIMSFFFFWAKLGILNIRQLSVQVLWSTLTFGPIYTRPICRGMHLRQTFRHLRIPQHFHFWLSHVHLTFFWPSFAFFVGQKSLASSSRHFILGAM